MRCGMVSETAARQIEHWPIDKLALYATSTVKQMANLKAWQDDSLCASIPLKRNTARPLTMRLSLGPILTWNYPGSERNHLMQSRLDPQKISPEAYRAMLGLETFVRRSKLEPSLVELIKMRASQINGCAFCLDM